MNLLKTKLTSDCLKLTIPHLIGNGLDRTIKHTLHSLHHMTAPEGILKQTVLVLIRHLREIFLRLLLTLLLADILPFTVVFDHILCVKLQRFMNDISDVIKCNRPFLTLLQAKPILQKITVCARCIQLKTRCTPPEHILIQHVRCCLGKCRLRRLIEGCLQYFLQCLFVLFFIIAEYLLPFFILKGPVPQATDQIAKSCILSQNMDSILSALLHANGKLRVQFLHAVDQIGRLLLFAIVAGLAQTQIEMLLRLGKCQVQIKLLGVYFLPVGRCQRKILLCKKASLRRRKHSAAPGC